MTVSATRSPGAGVSGPAAPLYVETQRYKSWIFWVPVVGVTVATWWQFVEQVVLGRPQGTEPIPDWLAWVFLILFGVGLPIFASLVRLVTEVRPGVLSVRLAPFRGPSIPTEKIVTAEVRRYSPIKEYGGWGVRVGRAGAGRAYNAYGDEGVQLALEDGRRVLIGSQRSGELLQAIRTAGGAQEPRGAKPTVTELEDARSEYGP